MTPDDISAMIAIPAAIADSFGRMFMLALVGTMMFGLGGSMFWYREPEHDE